MRCGRAPTACLLAVAAAGSGCSYTFDGGAVDVTVLGGAPDVSGVPSVPLGADEGFGVIEGPDGRPYVVAAVAAGAGVNWVPSSLVLGPTPHLQKGSVRVVALDDPRDSVVWQADEIIVLRRAIFLVNYSSDMAGGMTLTIHRPGVTTPGRNGEGRIVQIPSGVEVSAGASFHDVQSASLAFDHAGDVFSWWSRDAVTVHVERTDGSFAREERLPAVFYVIGKGAARVGRWLARSPTVILSGDGERVFLHEPCFTRRGQHVAVPYEVDPDAGASQTASSNRCNDEVALSTRTLDRVVLGRLAGPALPTPDGRVLLSCSRAAGLEALDATTGAVRLLDSTPCLQEYYASQSFDRFLQLVGPVVGGVVYYAVDTSPAGATAPSDTDLTVLDLRMAPLDGSRAAIKVAPLDVRTMIYTYDERGRVVIGKNFDTYRNASEGWLGDWQFMARGALASFSGDGKRLRWLEGTARRFASGDLRSAVIDEGPAGQSLLLAQNVGQFLELVDGRVAAADHQPDVRLDNRVILIDEASRTARVVATRAAFFDTLPHSTDLLAGRLLPDNSYELVRVPLPSR